MEPPSDYGCILFALPGAEDPSGGPRSAVNLRLIFSGAQLDDHRTIDSYGVRVSPCRGRGKREKGQLGS